MAMAFKGVLQHLRVAWKAWREQKKEPRAPKKHAIEMEFLPAYLEILERPPSKVGRFFGLGIMGLCTLTLLWAILGEIDVIASAPGKVIVGHHSKVVQAPEQGEVTHIAVRDGQAVKKGDVLIELNPTTSKAETWRLRQQLDFSALEVARLVALLSDDPKAAFQPPQGSTPNRVERALEHLKSEFQEQQAKQRTFAAQLRQNQARQKAAQSVIAESQALLKNVRERYESRKELADRGNFPRLQLLELEKELIEQERDLSEQQSNLEVLRADAETLKSEAQQQKTEWHRNILERLDEERRRLVDLNQELVKAQEKSRLQTILAPVDGVVQQLAMHTVGGVVTPGQELMVIVPDSADLEAEITVLNKDVGFVRSGQPVEVKIDSFPYTKYGTVKGEVLYVSRDSTEDEKLGLVYPARVKLAALSLSIDGEEVPLSAGMRVTAEIKTGDRRVIEYLLSPLQEYQSEALKER